MKRRYKAIQWVGGSPYDFGVELTKEMALYGDTARVISSGFAQCRNGDSWWAIIEIEEPE